MTMGIAAACRLRIVWPVAVPDKIIASQRMLDFIDRCHSLPSFPPPLAAVGSLPMVGMTVDLAVAVEESLK